MKQIIANNKEKLCVKGIDLRIEEGEALFSLKAYGERGKFYLKVIWSELDKRFVYGIFKISPKSKHYMHSYSTGSLNEAIILGAQDLAAAADEWLWPEGYEG